MPLVRRLLVIALALALPAFARADTLSKIRDSGEISIGYREYSVPFSYLDGDQKPIGFAMDLCARIADAVRDELKLPALQTKLKPVQMSSLIPLIQNNAVDIICGPVSNTLERENAVGFSDTYFVSSIRAAVRSDSAVKTFADLNGKPVALTSATTAIGLLAARGEKEGFKTKNLLSADHAASFLNLTTGRADAFVMDDILLASMIATSAKPGDWRLIDDALRADPYGLVIRKDDAGFKAVVDRTLVGLMKGGEFQKLYDKWFTSPIPPKNINLNFPMSAALKSAVTNPNDKGI